MNSTEYTHVFGGRWTEKKLAAVKEYLQAYAKVLKNQSFEKWYIDAFAGAGDWVIKQSTQETQTPLFETEEDGLQFRNGSVKNALEVTPPFDGYLFLEKDPEKQKKLEQIREKYPDRNIQPICCEANEYIVQWCNRDWRNTRAVMFLDPFGMSVNWTTIEAIANTKSIDMCYLFPIGEGVNRLLRNDGNIPDSHRKMLDDIFGTTKWYESFYRKTEVTDLFGSSSSNMEKAAKFDQLQKFMIERLESIFPWVEQNPIKLYNSKGSLLYLLCFAVGNKNGAKVASGIIQHISRKFNRNG